MDADFHNGQVRLISAVINNAAKFGERIEKGLRAPTFLLADENVQLCYVGCREDVPTGDLLKPRATVVVLARQPSKCQVASSSQRRILRNVYDADFVVLVDEDDNFSPLSLAEFNGDTFVFGFAS